MSLDVANVAGPAGRESRRYGRYLLALLALILAFNFVDRLALGLLLQSIKTDLALTDTELGILGGIAFALFYATMGVPISRWADRGNRVTIIALTTALWSAAVMLCGAAASFGQLLLIRVGVAVGEAGCMPPAHSLIADRFSRSERPRATALYLLGGPGSVLIGYFLAGWLNDMLGWRLTFVILGAPGLALAVIAAFTLREPRRRIAGNSVDPATMAPSLAAVVATLWRMPSFRHLLAAYALISFFTSGIMQWQPAFFIRSHGMTTGALGTALALAYGAGGLIGTYGGGALAARCADRRERLQLLAMAGVAGIYGLLSTGIYLTQSQLLALLLIALGATVLNAINGPLFATIQTLVPATMRATAIAIVLLSANFIGLGLGPLAVGALADTLRPSCGEESLRYALLSLSPGYFWAALHMLLAARRIEMDLSASTDQAPQ